MAGGLFRRDRFPRAGHAWHTERFSDAALGGGMAASIFSGRSLGYLVVGLLAFALGVCVTVLCVRLRGHEGDSADEERYDD